MNPQDTGRSYDKIVSSWVEHHKESNYGLRQLERALGFCGKGRKALDIGCGAGGRFIYKLEESGFCVTGIDVSEMMIKTAKSAHPSHTFSVQDICTWETDEKFDLIIAWDSIFHLPLLKQEDVTAKLCTMLNEGGVIMYSFGNAVGEHTDIWLGDRFYYSSIGIRGNLKVLIKNMVTPVHLELDQMPDDRHAYLIAKKA